MRSVERTTYGVSSSGRGDFVGTLIARGMAAPLAFLANIVLARLLGPEQFGIYMALLSVGLISGGVAAYGVGPVLTREVARRNAPLRPILSWALRLTGVLSTAAVLVTAVWLSAGTIVGAPPSTLGDIAATSLLIPLSVWLVVASAVLNGMSLVAQGTAIGNLWKNGLLLLGALILLQLDLASANAALWVQVMSIAASIAIGIYWVTASTRSGLGADGDNNQRPSASNASNDVASAVEWRRAAGHFFAVSAAISLLNRVDVVLVNALAGSTQAGVFGAAARLAQVGGIAGLAWVGWLQPRVSLYFHTGKTNSLFRALQLGLLGAVGMTAMLVVAGWFLAPWLVSFLGKGFEETQAPFRLLLVGYIFWALSVPSYALLAMTGYESTLSKLLWVQTIATLVASFPLVRTYGALGGAVAWAGGMAFGSIAVVIVATVYRKRQLSDANCS